MSLLPEQPGVKRLILGQMDFSVRFVGYVHSDYNLNVPTKENKNGHISLRQFKLLRFHELFKVIFHSWPAEA